MLRISNLKLDVNENENKLIYKVSKMLRLPIDDIDFFSIYKKSIDAREKHQVKYVYTVDITTNNETKYASYKNVEMVKRYKYMKVKNPNIMEMRPVVVGSGYSGLFATLILAEQGYKPILIERGKDITKRKEDIQQLFESGALKEESNIQFGAGGFGVFSDGSLTTSTKDNLKFRVLNELFEAGAAEEVRYLSKPVIGIETSINIINKMCEKITKYGGEIRFEEKLVNLTHENNTLKSIEVKKNNESYKITTNNLVLAMGSSARDTIEMLHLQGVKMTSKSFYVGLRVEHSQKMINEQQYGSFAKHLGNADYSINTKLSNGRNIYTFSMCQGGFIVNSSATEGALVVNGTSYDKQNTQNASSGLLVSVTPKDFGEDHPLAGIKFQQELEEKAFKLGGSNNKAPIQLLGDFLDDKKTTQLGEITPSYKPDITFAELKECLPDFVTESIKEGIQVLNSKLNGCMTKDAILVGVETNSASPVMIDRDYNTLEANIKGVYPCGYGSGHCFGIIASAIDGIKCAEAIIKNI
jgi:uncharacterized protein